MRLLKPGIDISSYIVFLMNSPHSTATTCATLGSGLNFGLAASMTNSQFAAALSSGMSKRF